MSEIQKLYNEEFLMSEPDEAIKALYRQTMGSEPHHKMGKQRMVIEIIGAQDVMKAPEAEPQKPIAEPVKSPNVTLEQLHDVLAKHIERGLKVTMDGDIWTLKNGVAIDSGHVSVPIGLIKVIADGLMRARIPAKIGQKGQEMFV